MKQATRERDEAEQGRGKGKGTECKVGTVYNGQLTVRYRKPMRDGTGRDRVEGRREERSEKDQEKEIGRRGQCQCQVKLG